MSGRGGLGRGGGSETFALLLFGGVEFGEELGGLGFEVVGASAAAKEDDAVGLAGGAVHEAESFTHGAEGFVGDEAGLQRVGGAGLGDEGGVGGGRGVGGFRGERGEAAGFLRGAARAGGAAGGGESSLGRGEGE